MLLTAILASWMTSCEDEKAELQNLNSPVANLYSSSVNSLTFIWDAVENATQYAYELSDPSGTVVSGDVTSKTIASFTGLKSNTTYTFTVWAYGVLDEYSKSKVATITATTDAVVQLDTPSLTVNTTGGVTVSWGAIADAASYEYSYGKEGESMTSGSTTDTSVSIPGLSSGTYSFEIYAKSGDEAHSDSETATISFTVDRQELWRVTGDFSCGDVTGERELVAYDNGSYSLKSWFGVEGYDLDFTVNSDGTINITNAYYNSYGYYYVYSTSTDAYRCLYPGGGYSSFYGTRSSGGLWCYDYYASDYYVQFYWDSSSVSFIDSLVGTYSQNTSGQTLFIDWYNWTAFTATDDVTIAKVDDSTVTVTGIYYEDESLTATVDETARTLTFAPQTWLTYYLFCPYDKPTESLTATVDEDGTITLSNWTAYYESYSYSYVYDTSTTLTKK